jgi:hypothetical protein
MGEMRSVYTILVDELEERNHSEDLDVDGMIILECFRMGSSGGLL